MAPTLRSSAQNTPTRSTAKSPNSSASSLAGTPTNPSSTPRKTHTCTKCKRPKAGHPRSGCPYVDSPSGPSATTESDDDDYDDEAIEHAASASPQQLSNALESLRIQSATPTRGSPGKRDGSSRRRELGLRPMVPSDTVDSLSTTSSEIVAGLARPGVMGNATLDADGWDVLDEKASKGTKIVRWQDLVSTVTQDADRSPERNPRVRMPCTLVTPSPSSSLLSAGLQDDFIETPGRKAGPELASIGLSSSGLSLASSVSSNSTTIPARALVRTMSMQERQLFIDRVNEASKATIYTLPRADIPEIQSSATALGFFSRTIDIPSRLENEKKVRQGNGDKDDEESWLILGRTERAVQRLYDNVEQDLNVRQEPSRRVSGIGAAAGGAVVGAVATFTGLAFS